jgi:hypothetical protein
MRASCKSTKPAWQFDNMTIVRNQMTFVRSGGRKVIIAPDGGDAWAPAKPQHDETLIRGLARGASAEADAGGGAVSVCR